MSVTLSSGVRKALTSLQSTAAAAQQTQFRLATGKKVNSALDSPPASSRRPASQTAPPTSAAYSTTWARR
jgi:hypothetical protein